MSKETNTTVKLSKKRRNKHCSNPVLMVSGLILFTFLTIAQHESGTSKTTVHVFQE